MTLGELWEQFGEKCYDYPIVFDMNGEGAVHVRGAIDYEIDTCPVILLTNIEGAKEAYAI